VKLSGMEIGGKVKVVALNSQILGPKPMKEKVMSQMDHPFVRLLK